MYIYVLACVRACVWHFFTLINIIIMSLQLILFNPKSTHSTLHTLHKPPQATAAAAAAATFPTTTTTTYPIIFVNILLMLFA